MSERDVLTCKYKSKKLIIDSCCEADFSYWNMTGQLELISLFNMFETVKDINML